jgi:hypothetical protein
VGMITWFKEGPVNMSIIIEPVRLLPLIRKCRLSPGYQQNPGLTLSTSCCITGSSSRDLNEHTDPLCCISLSGSTTACSVSERLVRDPVGAILENFRNMF